MMVSPTIFFICCRVGCGGAGVRLPQGGEGPDIPLALHGKHPSLIPRGNHWTHRFTFLSNLSRGGNQGLPVSRLRRPAVMKP
jgi:hypothetical protein